MYHYCVHRGIKSSLVSHPHPYLQVSFHNFHALSRQGFARAGSWQPGFHSSRRRSRPAQQDAQEIWNANLKFVRFKAVAGLVRKMAFILKSTHKHTQIWIVNKQFTYNFIVILCPIFAYGINLNADHFLHAKKLCLPEILQSLDSLLVLGRDLD
jgi:hypothetical protein